MGVAAFLLAAAVQAGDSRVDAVQAGAPQAGASQIMINTDAQAIVAQQREIQAEAAAGRGRYKEMNPTVMGELRGHQTLVLQLLEDKESSTELPREQQMELFNSLEAISAIINKAEDDRMICRRERTVGSRMATNVCRTVGERRAEQQEARDAMTDRGTLCTTCGPQSGWRGGSN
ncbi:hypothetical protein [Luteimonas sp. A478]